MEELDKIKEEIERLKKENKTIKICIYGLIQDTRNLRIKEREVLDDKCYRSNNENRGILLSDRSDVNSRNNKINI